MLLLYLYGGRERNDITMVGFGINLSLCNMGVGHMLIYFVMGLFIGVVLVGLKLFIEGTI